MFRPLSFFAGLTVGAIAGAAAIIYIPGAKEAFLNLLSRSSKEAIKLAKKGGQAIVDNLSGDNKKENFVLTLPKTKTKV